jgi:uncharacterized protein with HEPN domain
MASRLIQDAILHNLQMLSESTMRISETMQENHP